ncbi:hypothetical protein V6767_18960 [Martelella sp. FLE1502]
MAIREALLFLIFPFALVIYYFSHISPNATFHYALTAGLVGFSFFGLRRAAMLFVIFMILIDDFPKNYGEEAIEAAGFLSLYTLSIAGQTLYLVLAIYFTFANLMAMIAEDSINNRGKLILTGFSPEMKVVLLLGVVSALIGLPNILDAFRIYISDSGFFVNILLGYMIVRSISDSTERMEFFFRAVIFAIGAKVFIVLFDVMTWSSGLGLVTIKPGTDSYLAIAVIIFAGLSAQEWAARRPIRLLGVILTISGTLAYYVLTAARGRIVIGILALAAYMITVKARWWLAYAILLTFAAIAILRVIPEQFIFYLSWKLSSFGASAEAGESSLVRLVSLQNIIAQQFATVYQLFLGTGLGGYFTSKYVPFPIALTDAAFPFSWIIEDKFYRPHGSLMFMLLKTGMAGFILFYGTIAWQNARLLFRLRSLKATPFALRRLLLVCAPLILPLMIVNFSSKLQLLTGVMLGFTYFGWRSLRARKAATP